MDDGNIDKNSKGTKKCIIKRSIMFNNYVECAEKKENI